MVEDGAEAGLLDLEDIVLRSNAKVVFVQCKCEIGQRGSAFAVNIELVVADPRGT